MKLISYNSTKGHVSYDCIEEFEAGASSVSVEKVSLPFNRLLGRWSFLFWTLTNYSPKVIRLLRQVSKILPQNRDYFAILMGGNYSKCFPYCFYSSRQCLYMFDAWPAAQDKLKKIADGLEIDVIFFSSKQAAESMRKIVKHTRCHWIAEGVDPDEYTYLPVEERTIDVLAMGRKYDKYHQVIVNELENAGISYFYQKDQGEIIFPTRSEFLSGLANSKISICVPTDITHPDKAGGTSTMTNRYLQSIASKCLILGSAPVEMVELFGYNPVIEIDWENPVAQIDNLLENYRDYQSLIDKNYETLVENHTWAHRWEQIQEMLASETTKV